MIWLLLVILMVVCHLKSKQLLPYSRSYPETRADLYFDRTDPNWEAYLERVREAVQRNYSVYSWKTVDMDTAYTPILHPNAPGRWQKDLWFYARRSKFSAFWSVIASAVLVEGVMRVLNHGHGLYYMLLPLFKGRLVEGATVYAVRDDGIWSLLIGIVFVSVIRSWWEQTRAIESQIQGYLDGHYDGYADAIKEWGEQERAQSKDN